MRRLRLRAGALGAFIAVWSMANPAAADQRNNVVTVPSGASVTDFNCTSSPIKTQPTTPGAPAEPEVDRSIPTAADVGALARMVRVAPPALDRSLIAGFALDGRDGAPRPRRVAIWGDSHIAAGPMMNQLRQAVLNRGETIGARFLPPTMGRSNVRLPMLHDYCIGPDWTTDLAYKSNGMIQTGPGLANRIGLAGKGTYLWLDLRTAEKKPQIAQIQIVYQPSEAPTTLTLQVNDGPEVTVALASRASAPGVVSASLGVRSSTLIHTMKMRIASGKLVLEGFILDYAKPPTVTFDVFGVPSSTAEGWASADPAALQQALHGDTYDAVALEYGTNEGNVEAFDSAEYTASLTATLTNLRAVFPKASCMLMGPPDRGILINRGRGARPDFLKFARIHQQIAAIQANVGARFSCAAWNWQKFMGGPGGIYGWVHNNPVLAGGDLTHMTMAGYRMTGAALAKSLGWTDVTVDAIPTR